ncbi:hypothetical protein [Adhaeretor mobilis]|uniref:hypothetical protein n=1 Tax=Adhaeretor mobilis TaxID=1930276 RepID=UPI001C54C4A5|nr:hypothetical protein [Adhaeretor mobilis]
MAFALKNQQLFMAVVVWLGANLGTVSATGSIWDFEGDLGASLGSGVMTYRGNTSTVTQFGTPASFGLPSLFGNTDAEQIMAFPAADSTQGYAVAHNAGAAVDEYTMMWDVLYPESSDVAWRAMMQTVDTNGNDADFFVRNVPWGGVGISNEWHVDFCKCLRRTDLGKKGLTCTDGVV